MCRLSRILSLSFLCFAPVLCPGAFVQLNNNRYKNTMTICLTLIWSSSYFCFSYNFLSIVTVLQLNCSAFMAYISKLRVGFSNISAENLQHYFKTVFFFLSLHSLIHEALVFGWNFILSLQEWQL